jgi:hypothetical protein
VRRQLYSDADLIVYSFRRAVIVTSIDLGAAKGDFGDRLLPINLDPISETQRLTDRARRCPTYSTTTATWTRPKSPTQSRPYSPTAPAGAGSHTPTSTAAYEPPHPPDQPGTTHYGHDRARG